MNVMLMKLTSVSEAFDEGTKVELKYVVEFNDNRGELYMRVNAHEKSAYVVGDIYTARLVRLP